jgi:alginate production protein
MNTRTPLILTLALATATAIAASSLPPTEAPAKIGASDSGAAPKTRHTIAPGLLFGAKLELEVETLRNADLDRSRGDDFAVFTPTFSLAFSYEPTDWLQAFVNFELQQNYIFDDDTESRIPDDDLHLRVRDAYLRFKITEGVALQIGRQRFKDSREWLVDERLDAVRLLWQWEKWTLDASWSRQNLGDDDALRGPSDDEETDNLLFSLRYDFTEDLHASAYVLHRNDRTADAHSPVFYGVHLDGEIVNDLEVWLEAAHVRGRDGDADIRGWGFDLGATYEFDHDTKPSITFGYAFGSGDKASTPDIDESFRQSGLQDNSAKYNGVTRLGYYGEVLDPELSNLSIITLGAGIRPTRRSSIDLVYHHYLQHHREAARVRDADVRTPTNGRHHNVGGELDLVVGYREIKDLDIELTVGCFLPGEAYDGDAGPAFLAALKFRYQF